MVAKYFLYSELCGWLGVVLFSFNTIYLAVYYSLFFTSKNRHISWVWFGVNIFFWVIQVLPFCGFVILLGDASLLSGMGKLDMASAEAFIGISFALLGISLVYFILAQFLQNYWGIFLRKGRIWLSFTNYQKEDFIRKNHITLYGKRHKWKVIYNWTASAKGLNELVNGQEDL